MQLVNFATKTEIIHRENRTVPDVWPVGIDYGFSGIKCFSPNKTFCFPNCAVKLEKGGEQSLIDPSDSDIMLRDSTGTWIVGEKAHEIMDPETAINYEDEMYGRNRYFSPTFGALMKVGLGLAVASNEIRHYQGERIVVQTGLPPKFREADTEMLQEALAGAYDFEMKIGRGQFQRYAFVIDQKDVRVMDQPMGSLICAIMNNDGTQTQEDYRVLRGNTLVLDPGFKTLDVYDISAGMFKDSNTFDNLGMHEVFKRTVAELKQKYHANVTVPGMQSALRKGYVNAFDRRTMGSKRVAFDDVVERNSRAVCGEAIQKILSLYNYLQDFDFMIVTGGTGNAWTDLIEDYFRNMESLTIVSANKNDPSLSNVFSNVRGYYMYLVAALSRRR